MLCRSNSDWQKMRREMDLSSSLIEPILEAIPQLIIIMSIFLYALTLADATRDSVVDTLFTVTLFDVELDGYLLFGVKFILSMITSIWGLFRVFRDGPCTIPAPFRIGVIFFSAANIFYPISVALTFLSFISADVTQNRVRDDHFLWTIVIRSSQTLILLSHGPLWSLYRLKQNLSWSVIANVVTRSVQ